MSNKLDQLKIREVNKMADNALLAMALSAPQAKYYSLQFTGRLLAECENSLQMLYTTPVSELHQRLGLPLADSYKLKAMFELAERRKINEVMTKPKISCSNDVYQLFQYLSSSPYEEFWIILLNKANRIINRIKISEGGVSGTVVDPKKIFHVALETLASGLILVHNHPSGNLEPSEADKQITQKIADGGKLLEINVLDHVIIANDQYSSFADNGMIP